MSTPTTNPLADTFTVLVVDDESNIRLMLHTALEPDGYTVLEAEDGKAALATVERAPPNVVLLDLSMPVMDGPTFLQRLNDLDLAKRPAVIVLTAYGTIDAAVKAMKLGAIDFIEKPATPDKVRAAVEAAIIQQASKPEAGATTEPTYDETLGQIREAMRAGKMRSVELMLMKAGTIAPHNDAAFLNLAGVFHEAGGRVESAQKFYGRAKRVDPHFAAAEENLQRLYELDRFNKTTRKVALGDEWHPDHSIPGNPTRLTFGRLLRYLTEGPD
ncbi:MAG: two component, sigma54 specific, transcriptional regulator, Fis family [Phycisphaerales bacterium]|nr:two component, sigma54 specific, transcriptional regulator, Fis family [Phycisphaerales bacterium]